MRRRPRAARAIYKEYCAACHGAGGRDFSGEHVGKVTPLAEIGTDRRRLDSYTYDLAVNQATLYAGYDWRFTHFRKTYGYANMPLDGLWLRAPYLHNGSVPTLRDLLEPGGGAAARSSIAATTSTIRRSLGFVSDVPEEGGRTFFRLRHRRAAATPTPATKAKRYGTELAAVRQGRAGRVPQDLLGDAPWRTPRRKSGMALATRSCAWLAVLLRARRCGRRLSAGTSSFARSRSPTGSRATRRCASSTARSARNATPASRTGSSTCCRACFPDKLPGPGGYASLGVSWEQGQELPVGFTKKVIGFPRVGQQLRRLPYGELPAVGATRTRPSSPRAPGTRSTSSAFFRFLVDCAKDPRFNADNLMREIELVTELVCDRPR